MEELILKLKTLNPDTTVLVSKFETAIRIINEINPTVFDRIRVDSNGNPVKIN